MEDMKRLGFDEYFAALAAEHPGLEAGRVVLQERGGYRVVCADAELPAAVSGRLRHEALRAADFPTVGDFVMLSRAEGAAVIHSVLPRKSVFSRKAAGRAPSEQLVAANVDTVFVCMSLNSDFNLRRLERYMSTAWESGATPVVVLTKSDLCGEVDEKLSAARSAAGGAEVLAVSSLGRDGAAALKPYLREGATVALLGSSGVGKSTLINRLLGEERLATGAIRDDDGKGRHTTTHRELVFMQGGGMLIDTPGMRELGLWDADEGLERSFSDVERLAESCRFADCTHRAEPGCAVRAALEDGSLSRQRWASYQKLRAENEYSRSAESYLEAKNKRNKQIARISKQLKKR